MDDLIIVDNALSESESTHLENILISDAFPYHEGMDIDPHRFASPEECPDIIVSSTAVTTPQLFHVCHNREIPITLFTTRTPVNCRQKFFRKSA